MKIISARVLPKSAAVEPENEQSLAPAQEPIDTTVQAPDLEKEVLETPLEEEQGLNSVVENLANNALDAIQEWMRSNAYQLIDSLKHQVNTRFTTHELKNSPIGGLAIELNLKAGNAWDFVEAKDGGIVRLASGNLLIRIYLIHNDRFLSVPPRFQVQSLNSAVNNPALKSVLVHELAHAHENAARLNNNSAGLWDSKAFKLGEYFKNEPILKSIGERIYIIDDPELNARIAEVASSMKNLGPDLSNHYIYNKVRESRIWGEIKFLKAFKSDEAYQKIIADTEHHYANELPKGDKMATEALIAEKIRDVLYQVRFDGGNGHSKTNNRLMKILSYRLNGETAAYRIKELKDIFKGLEALFFQKAEELQKRVYKTIGLARSQSQSAEANGPEAALAEEDTLSEAYPASFDMGEFRDLNNFTERIRYCEQHLKRINSGSSRIVYDVDGEKVLKLAKNSKGIAQNELEAQYMFQNDYGTLVAKVFDTHPRDLWIEMEKAQKLTPTRFQHLTGVDLKNLGIYICNRSITGYRVPQDPRVVSMMDENEFVRSLLQMVNDFQLHPGDMDRITTWGLVHRDGHEQVVLVDFGLTQDGFESHYANPSSASRYRHQSYQE